ncbi:MAG: hypothetical protein PVH19_01100 [Planctomycetia bacterium]|jgi:hypothetical protein
MARKLLFLTTLVILFAGLATSSVTAEPWNLSLNKVDADPDKSYTLQETDGPWLILAATFSGDGGAEQAHDLVLELRKRHKLPAYVHDMKVKLDKDTGGRGIDRYNQPIKWKYRRGNQHEEIAVLVGHFADSYDPKGKETLKQIKLMKPDCLSVKKRGKTNMNLARVREAFKTILAPGNEKKKKGPMGQAFLVRNPLSPMNDAVQKALDPFVVDLNKGVKYSLLEAKGKYTVQVAHFTGKVITDQGAINKIKTGQLKLNESRLKDAAMKADKLTKALRMKGYEAYQFHDRQASLVTVGSFNSVGSPRKDGKIEINPQILKIIETFKGQPSRTTGKLGSRLVVGIPLDLQPIPVEIPKESITSTLVRRSNNDD